MREGVGSIFLYNIIIVFIVLIFAFLAGTLTYYKAFKVNNVIINALEKYEGYNKLSVTEINKQLNTIGYLKDPSISCPRKSGVEAMQSVSSVFSYCVYEFSEGNDYRSYGVITFVTIDLPIIGGVLKLPVYSKTKLLYDF